MRTAVIVFLIIGCLGSLSAIGQAADELIVNQTTLPVVTLVDQGLIRFFLDEFFIPETLVTKMDIIDVSLNGFGENDIVRLYPSDQIYFLQYVSDKAQTKMNEWKFTANFQITAKNSDVRALDDYHTNRPAYNIFGAILAGLNRNYKDYPIKIRFERDSSTVIFELWSYNEQKLRELPNSTDRLPDEMVKYIHAKTDTTLRDCIYIYKTVRDTIYIPVAE